MKKFLICLLIFCLMASFSGCQKEPVNQKEAKRLVVFAKDATNSGLVLFFDEDGNLLFERETEYPYTLFFDDDAIYVSENGKDYTSLLYKDGTSGNTLKNYINPIAGLSKDGYYSILEGGICKIYNDGSENCHEEYTTAAIKGNDYFYYIDSNNLLHTCDLNDFKELSINQLEASDRIEFTKVNGEVYIVQDHGYTRLEGTNVGQTFIYPNDFTEILNVIDGMIFFEENEETVAYAISFDKYRMVLTPIYNEEYYRPIDFDKEYKAYFDKGYDIVEIYDIGI